MRTLWRAFWWGVGFVLSIPVWFLLGFVAGIRRGVAPRVDASRQPPPPTAAGKEPVVPSDAQIAAEWALVSLDASTEAKH